MELPSKILEQIPYNTRPKIEEHMLIVMNKSTHEEHLSQPLQTNIIQDKIAVIFLTGFKDIVKITNKNIKFFNTKLINDDDFSKIFISPGTYEIESKSKKNKRDIIEEGYFEESNCPITIKPNFSNLGSIIKNPSNITVSLIAFTPVDSIRDLSGFEIVVLHEELKYLIIPLLFYHLILFFSNVV